MGEQSVNQAPLLSKDENFGHLNERYFRLSSVKLFLRVAMLVIFIAWAAFLFLMPVDSVSENFRNWASQENAWETGRWFLAFGGPVLIITLLGITYLVISGEERVHGNKSKQNPSFRLWTFPVIVGGPFGVVSAAELIGIVLFSVFVIWAVSLYTIKSYKLVPFLKEFEHVSDSSSLMAEALGNFLGLTGLFCLAFLFLPVARGSLLLRLVDIPFEHAVKYHVWLGHLTMFLFTVHGLSFVVVWAIQGRLQNLLEWGSFGVANLPGVISLLAGLLMWVTSLPLVRRINFELFFYTHQLYVVFVVFLALHVGDYIFSVAAAGIFLYMLDRFLRFCQSRRTVDILSASSLPCGTVELCISKPPNLQYNALSWMFIQIRELSWLQWHPFSVSSSPLDGKYHISVLIKSLGNWTQQLRGHILNESKEESEMEPFMLPNSKITACVEGPYGHESSYHLMYEDLILVAGGIGISPFLAILSDILHNINDGKPCLPRNILVIWAVKKSDELPLLHTFDMKLICPFFADALNLEIQTYVTRESEPSLEEGKVDWPSKVTIFPTLKNSRMSSLVGTGNIIWSGAYVLVSIIGLVISMALLNFFYIIPFNVTSWWYKGLLFIACMVASVLVCGGLVISLWHIWDSKNDKDEEYKDDKKIGVQKHYENEYCDDSNEGCVSNTILYGQRPDFKGIFETRKDCWGAVDIGVIVCGPSSLQTSVAMECRAQNLSRRGHGPVFHFNSHSFDL